MIVQNRLSHSVLALAQVCTCSHRILSIGLFSLYLILANNRQPQRPYSINTHNTISMGGFKDSMSGTHINCTGGSEYHRNSQNEKCSFTRHRIANIENPVLERSSIQRAWSRNNASDFQVSPPCTPHEIPHSTSTRLGRYDVSPLGMSQFEHSYFDQDHRESHRSQNHSNSSLICRNTHHEPRERHRAYNYEQARLTKATTFGASDLVRHNAIRRAQTFSDPYMDGRLVQCAEHERLTTEHYLGLVQAPHRASSRRKGVSHPDNQHFY